MLVQGSSVAAPPPEGPAPAPRTRHAGPSGKRGQRVKPRKPYPEFPLFPHATGRWAKKIRGKFAFFGPLEDPDGAMERFVEQRDELMAGLVPRGRPAAGAAGAEADALTVMALTVSTPDETTFVRFRTRLLKRRLDRTLFDGTLKHLEKLGLLVKDCTL